MDFFLLQVFAFLRPIMFMDFGASVLGVEMLELAGVLLSAMIIAGLLLRATLLKELRLSIIDLTIGAFVLWCVAVWFVYIDKAYVKELAKLVIPLLTYTTVKNVVTDEAQYRRLMWLVILGFTIPLLWSTVLTVLGQGVYMVNYWSGEPRYRGVFTGPHEMAHYMTLILMLVMSYAILSRSGRSLPFHWGKQLFLGLLSVLALYCLYQTWVRTAMVGLVVFGFVLLVTFKKRLLAVALVGLAVIPLIFVDSVQKRLIYEVINAKEDATFQTADYAGGRPRMWKQFIGEFSKYPIDRQLAGIGIGNGGELWRTDIWGSTDDNRHEDANRIGISHNDFLEVLVQTGIIGLVIFGALQFLVLRAVLRLRTPQRNVFLALFVAVTVMNIGSASYVTRFGIAQMYCLLLAYIELPRRREHRTAAVASGSDQPAPRLHQAYRL